MMWHLAGGLVFAMLSDGEDVGYRGIAGRGSEISPLTIIENVCRDFTDEHGPMYA